MSARSLIEHSAALDDPRQFWKVLFSLPEILLLVFCSTLAGEEVLWRSGRSDRYTAWVEVLRVFVSAMPP